MFLLFGVFSYVVVNKTNKTTNTHKMSSKFFEYTGIDGKRVLCEKCGKGDRWTVKDWGFWEQIRCVACGETNDKECFIREQTTCKCRHPFFKRETKTRTRFEERECRDCRKNIKIQHFQSPRTERHREKCQCGNDMWENTNHGYGCDGTRSWDECVFCGGISSQFTACKCDKKALPPTASCAFCDTCRHNGCCWKDVDLDCKCR